MEYFEVIVDASTGKETIRPYTQEEVNAIKARKEAIAEAERASLQLTFAQLMIGLVSEGWLSVEDGRNWRDRVALPAPVVSMISNLPPEQQFIAETRAFAPSVILRMDPLVIMLGASQNKTPEEIDNFFRKYSVV